MYGERVNASYTPTRLWRDVYETIVNAEKIIYIAGTGKII